MTLPDRRSSRLRTATAMVALCWARLVIAMLPFRWWRNTLGGNCGSAGADVGRSRTFAAHVDWAAKLLPISTKCLPRAMALSWILRKRHIGHCLVFAVRPPGQRGADDQLHAWIEVAGERILGDLPGSWVETLRLGDSRPGKD